jgi:serine/threonine-protein kinase HipA
MSPSIKGRVSYEQDLKIELKPLVLDDLLHSSNEKLFDELVSRFALNSPISGVQPKVLAQIENKATLKLENYIVKSWGEDYPELALNEYLCMRVVQKANICVPKFYLSQDRKLFIMKRFDIKEDNSYLGFEDMCVLTGRGTEQKYDGSYEEIVRVIKDVISPQKRKESLKIFFKALVMNHLLKNGDGHLKNYGILYNNDFEDSYLAPIYDVITTKVYIKNDIPALRLSDGKLWWKEKTYRTFAKQSCGLSNAEYEIILEECKKAIIKTKNEINEFIVKNVNVKDFLENLISSWEEEF